MKKLPAPALLSLACVALFGASAGWKVAVEGDTFSGDKVCLIATGAVGGDTGAVVRVKARVDPTGKVIDASYSIDIPSILKDKGRSGYLDDTSLAEAEWYFDGKKGELARDDWGVTILDTAVRFDPPPSSGRYGHSEVPLVFFNTLLKKESLSIRFTVRRAAKREPSKVVLADFRVAGLEALLRSMKIDADGFRERIDPVASF